VLLADSEPPPGSSAIGGPSAGPVVDATDGCRRASITTLRKYYGRTRLSSSVSNASPTSSLSMSPASPRTLRASPSVKVSPKFRPTRHLQSSSVRKSFSPNTPFLGSAANSGSSRRFAALVLFSHNLN
jgi:hypothetical protein